MLIFDYWRLIVRNAKTVLVIALATMVLAGIIGRLMPVSYTARTLLTISANTDGRDNPRYDNYFGVTESDYFSETVMAWLKSRALGAEVGAKIRVKKDERSNLLLSVWGMDEAMVSEKSLVAVEVLRKWLAEYRESTGADFRVGMAHTTVDQIHPGARKAAPIGLVLGLILGVLLAFFREYGRGVISTNEQIAARTGLAPLMNLNLRHLKLAPLEKITAYCGGQMGEERSVLLAGVGVDIKALLINVANKLADFGLEPTVVDLDLRRREMLGKIGSVSRIKKVRGITDLNGSVASLRQIDKIILKTNQAGMGFVAAGGGGTVMADVLEELEKVSSTNLLYSSLPENSEILGKLMPETLLVVVVKMGKTKLADLDLILRLWPGEIDVITTG